MKKLIREKFSREQTLDYYDLGTTSTTSLGSLADSNPELMPAQTPQLLLQIGRHQQEENQEGREFSLWLGIACQM